MNSTCITCGLRFDPCWPFRDPILDHEAVVAWSDEGVCEHCFDRALELAA